MKYILIGALCLLHVCSLAQKAEPILPYAKERKEMNWYREQASAWKKIVDAHPKDAVAWNYYFMATRILINQNPDDQRSAAEKNKQLVGIAEDMLRELPESYEANYCRWQAEGNNMNNYPYLQKAISIAPERTDHIDYMINIGEMTRSISQRNTYSLKKIEAGQMSAGMMYYNYNMLQGLDKKAILITAGDHDTYPAWALQAKGVREDVLVLNIYLLQLQDYQKLIFSELGIPHNPDKAPDAESIISLISKNGKQRPVYVALTTAGCEKYIRNIEQNLYLCGLTYRYDTSAFDNVAQLKRNFENAYALDYIDKSFYDEISPEWVRMLNANYVVPMFKLYEHYRDSGDIKHQAWIRSKLELVAQGLEDPQSVLSKLD